MPYLAALTPPGWQISHIDEEVSPVDCSLSVDLVGITFHTPSAKHAYEIAAQFRRRGIPVALGGPHVTLCPEEAGEHADVIFIGEAENTWPEFLNDFAQKNYRSVYRPETVPDLTSAPWARKEFFLRKDFTNGVLFASRGCPHRCDFCTLSILYKNTLRKRPVADVAAEYASFKGKVIIFWDDNIAGDLAYAKELFRAISPYRKWWSSQASVHAGMDDEFLDLAAHSGCKQLFLGIESVSQDSLNHAHKRFNQVIHYSAIIRRIHSHGIAVQAGIVFGFDEDTPAIFDDTLQFLEENGVQNATFNILTPFPGTELYRRLENEGRILTTDWNQYNSRAHVVFRPQKMSSEELLNGYRRTVRRYYSIPSILKRLAHSPVQLWWTLPLNLAYFIQLQRFGTA